VVVASPADDVGGQAFPSLADQLFSKNKGKRKFAMTVPVTQSAAVNSRDNAPSTPWFMRRSD
jgi:hypothetical protein